MALRRKWKTWDNKMIAFLSEFKAGLHAYKYCQQPTKKGIAFFSNCAFKQARDICRCPQHGQGCRETGRADVETLWAVPDQVCES